MKKTLRILCAVMLAFATLLSFAGCEIGADIEEVTEDLTPVVSNTLPVTKEEIVNYFNDVINYVSTDSNFNGNSPEMRISEGFNVDAVKCLDNEGTETPERLKTLQDAANQIKKTILSSLPTNEMKPNNGETIPYGEGGLGKTIYPLDKNTVNLTVEDVDIAECRLDGEIYYIDIYVSSKTDSIQKVFEIPNKETVLSYFDTASNYADVADYTSTYISKNTREFYDKENPDNIECSRIHLETNSVTNKIMNVQFIKVANVNANVTGVNLFESFGNFTVNFRFKDTTTYSFIWTAPTVVE